MGALSHREPASAAKCRGSCRTHVSDKRYGLCYVLLVNVQCVIHYMYVTKYVVMPLNFARHFIASKII